MAERLTIVVAGAGGMGSLFGSILHQGGHQVTLYDIDAAHVDAVARNGLRIEGYGGDRVVPVPAVSDPGALGAADVVLFQCKSHGTRAAARSVRHLVRGGAVCISFQNGLGNEEIIGEEVGTENVLGGLTTMAATKLGPGVVRDFSRVPSYIGEMDARQHDRAPDLARALTSAGLETHASTDIRHEIWKKLIGNVAMSALSGITDSTGATCMGFPPLRSVCMRAAEEAMAVAAAEGLALDREAVMRGIEVISTPGGTGDNRSSLCVDLQNRRPTEVDVIYGSVIALGRKSAVPTPTLEALSGIVKSLEAKYLGDACC